jgi:hypothetical protein
MKYQLIIQWRADADDFDRLVAIEERVTAKLGNSAEVDGHDFGSGEFNVFVLTEDPTGTFQLIQEVIPQYQTKVAYRELHGEDFTILWPPNSEEFTVE